MADRAVLGRSRLWRVGERVKEVRRGVPDRRGPLRRPPAFHARLRALAHRRGLRQGRVLRRARRRGRHRHPRPRRQGPRPPLPALSSRCCTARGEAASTVIPGFSVKGTGRPEQPPPLLPGHGASSCFCEEHTAPPLEVCTALMGKVAGGATSCKC